MFVSTCTENAENNRLRNIILFTNVHGSRSRGRPTRTYSELIGLSLKDHPISLSSRLRLSGGVYFIIPNKSKDIFVYDQLSFSIMVLRS